MSFFESLGKGAENQPQKINPMEAIQQVKADPATFLKNAGVNVPDNIDLNNPQQIINYLVQSGQVSNNRMVQAIQMFKRMGFK